MNNIKKIVKEVESLTAEKVAMAEREKALMVELEAARLESIRLHEEAKSAVDEVCAGKYFCGVILTDEDLVNLLKVAIQKPQGESIKIPYQLYPIEDIHDTAEDPAGNIVEMHVVEPQKNDE